MVSIVAEKSQLENGEGSLRKHHQRYKRRKVSAVRDFPPGCGPDAAKINSTANAVVDVTDGIEVGAQKGHELADVDATLITQTKIEPQIGDRADLLVEGMNGENESKGLVKESDGPVKETTLESHQSLQNLEKTAASSCLNESLHETCDKVKDSTTVAVESSGVMGHTDDFGSEDRSEAVKVEEEMAVSPRLSESLHKTRDKVKDSSTVAVESSSVMGHTDDLGFEDSSEAAKVEKKVEQKTAVSSRLSESLHKTHDKVKDSSTVAVESSIVVGHTDDLGFKDRSEAATKVEDKTAVSSCLSESLGKNCDKVKDSSTVAVESSSVMGHTDDLGFQDRSKAVKADKKIEENDEESSSLAHYPVPSNIVAKKKNYPPRRRFSAVRDFPPGCGTSLTNLSKGSISQVAHKENNHLCGGKPASEKDDDVSTPEVKNIAVCEEEVVMNTTEGLVLEGTGDCSELRSECRGVSSANMTVKPIQFCKPTEVKGLQRSHEIKSDRRDGSVTVKSSDAAKHDRGVGFGDTMSEAIVVYNKEETSRRKSDILSRRSALSNEDCVAGENHVTQFVIVQGLMAAPNCPWRQGRGAVKPGSASATKGTKRRRSVVENENSKSVSCERLGDAGNSCIEPVKDMPPSVEADEYGTTHQLVLWDKGDSSADDAEFHSDSKQVRRSRDFNLSLPPVGATSSTDKGARSKVRETLRLFQAIVRKLLQEEEAKTKEKGIASKRVDLAAAKILKDKGKYVNAGKPILGPVPGAEVGDEFHYRVELAVIGLHRVLQGGIDYVKQGNKILATSIVASGGYANDMDSSNVLIYTGQGGNTTGGDKQPEDQKLERGNLALKNCADDGNYVRVIRGIKEPKPSDSADARGKFITTYTYDGLYKVERYWQDLGPHGKMVYKFELRRLSGQPELAWKEVKKSKSHKVREGRCVDDISGGKEKFPICAVNTIDDEKPPPFTYITQMMYPDWYRTLTPKGCDCVRGCSDSEKCACAVRNGGEIPYNYNGAIVEAKPLVYECTPWCKCPPSCHNRVSQHGIKFQLEIFKTESRGWGVRSLSSIPSGSFICEYIGELLEDKEAEQRTGNDEYLFDIGQNYNDSALWDGLSSLMPDAPPSSTEVAEEGFTIDAANYGNIGRFINHSCSPNLYAQNVLYDNNDKRIPHIMLFAAENIPPLQELTYHYNYVIDQVRDSDGNIKKKSCYCGASECTGRMY